MEDVYDVLRIILQGLARVGGITEEDRTAAHAVITEADPKVAQAEAEAAAAPLTDAEADELARLQARQEASQAEAPPPVAAPGAGFNPGPGGFLMADDKGGKSLLEQLIEEAAAKGKQSAEDSDFAINLTTTDSDGHSHSVQGVPISQARRFLYERFGIGDPPEAEAEGQGDEGGKGKSGGGATPLKRYFGQGDKTG